MSVLLGRLLAMREQLDAVIDAVEKAEAPPSPVCEHPEEKRRYTGDTMGYPSGFSCQQCGQFLVTHTPGA